MGIITFALDLLGLVFWVVTVAYAFRTGTYYGALVSAYADAHPDPVHSAVHFTEVGIRSLVRNGFNWKKDLWMDRAQGWHARSYHNALDSSATDSHRLGAEYIASLNKDPLS